MSTLTSSPSPIVSPRAATSTFHYSRRSSYAPSPRTTAQAKPSPRLIATTYSPRQRAVNARSSPASTASNVSPKHQPRAKTLEESTEQTRPRYADAGTQYSPEGYPPTAGAEKLAAIEQARRQTASGGKKRKDDARSRSPHMKTAGGAANAAAPPAEPQLRVDPNDERRNGGKGDGQDLPERPVSEPQEARSTHGHSSAPKRARAESGSVKVMPRAYEECNAKDLGVLISNMLMELIRLNDQIPLRDGRLTRFHSRAPPGISVADYLQRLIQHATLSPPILLSMVYYIDRLCALYSAFTINSLTVHRFLITAATVAAKGLSDSFWTNPTYARIGGIPTTELATLELEFLQKVQWKIVPKPETLEDYYNSLVDRTDGYQLEPNSGGTSGDSLEEDGSEDGDQTMRDPP